MLLEASWKWNMHQIYHFIVICPYICWSLHHFAYLSADGWNMNIDLHETLDSQLQRMFDLALLPFSPCCLHKVHKSYYKGILVYGTQVETVTFDLHSWFKIAPCKREDFMQVAAELQDKEILRKFFYIIKHFFTAILKHAGWHCYHHCRRWRKGWNSVKSTILFTFYYAKSLIKLLQLTNVMFALNIISWKKKISSFKLHFWSMSAPH